MEQESRNLLIMDLDDKYSSQTEETVLLGWKEGMIFDLIWSKSKSNPIYDLMDGPPFVSSDTLHYGHLLVGNAKSTMNYYKLMKGFNVYGKIGYDCHGLPVEMKVNDILGISNNDDVRKMGIDKYNAKCTEVIDSYSGSWEKIYNRTARMVDFDHDYKTKDVNFMESVWWGFSELHKKGLAYRGYNVVPYSIGCNTSLSNFEAKSNYKERDDISLYIQFPVVNMENTFFVAWTTTPWTVPSHLALAVNPKMVYVTIEDKKTHKKYIIAESNICNLYKNDTEYEIISRCVGDDLVGMEYTPPFSFFDEHRSSGAFRIYSDYFVKVSGEDNYDENETESTAKAKAKPKSKPIGTGVVHCAPGFGADDFNMCTKHFIAIEDIGKVCPIDDNGCFTNTIPDYAGHNVFDINKQIVKDLEKLGAVIKKENCKHKYPYCDRTNTPLIYKAVKSFFVRVTAFKDRIIEHNKKIHWVPEFVNKKFNAWLEDAKDWGISRSRFYGTPIPAWVSDDGLETIVIGSIDELVEKAGLTYRPDNLHPEFVSKIKIPSAQGKGMLTLVPDVLDCWFESGSVPFAQHHYPMENSNMFNDKEFMAEFVCEGIDQTRGWFYTLNVLSTALFDKPAFQHCICNGLILAENGKKMAKREKNYPDPFGVINEYGADALRLYLINSPAIRAESFRFVETGVYETKKTLIPWFESLKFLNSHLSHYLKKNKVFNCERYKETTNVMDKWIISCLGTLVKCIDVEMLQYKLYAILPKIVGFIENLTNWYVKLNRHRIKGIDQNPFEWETALSVLHYVLLSYAKISAPFTPLMSEYMYSHLKIFLPNDSQQMSILMCDYPEPVNFPSDSLIEVKINNLQTIMNMVRVIRAKTPGLSSVKIPLKSITVANDSVDFLSHMKELEEYFYDEINTLAINLTDLKGIVKYNVLPNHRGIGEKYRKDAKKIKSYIGSLTEVEIKELMENNSISVTIDDNAFDIVPDDVVVSPEIIYNTQENEVASIDSGTVVIVNFTQDQAVINEHTSRMFNYYVQAMRKNASLTSVDNIVVNYYTEFATIHNLIEKSQGSFESRIKAKVNKISVLDEFEKNLGNTLISSDKFDFDGNVVQIFITSCEN